MAKILILNGSPRKNGKTASLVKAFAEGAESVGNEINEMLSLRRERQEAASADSFRKTGDVRSLSPNFV